MGKRGNFLTISLATALALLGTTVGAGPAANAGVPAISASAPLAVAEGVTAAADGASTYSISGQLTGVGTLPTDMWVWAYALSGVTTAGPAAADGTFSITPVPVGTYVLCIEDARFVPVCWGGPTWETATHIEITDHNVDGINVQVKVRGEITGKVTWRDLDTNVSAPLVGAQISILDLEDPFGAAVTSVTTDSQGNFLASGLLPGTYVARARWLAQDPWLNTEYWNDAWFVQAADPVTIVGDDSRPLGTIEMNERTLLSARLAGADRFATAVEVSHAFFPDANPSVPVVYIANGLDYPDALAAGPAAAIQGGVLLIATPTSLPQVTATELLRLMPERVVIVGGLRSIGDSVESQIGAIVGASRVDRFGGVDRFETGRLIVQDAFTDLPQHEVFVATGLNYPDALSGGPAAAKKEAPIILVNGGADGLDQPTLDLLNSLPVWRVTILGGESSVSAGIQQSVRDDFLTPQGFGDTYRLAGADRYQTSNLVNDWSFNYWESTTDSVFVAVGTNFADALTGGPLASGWRSPLFLSPKECLNPGVVDSMIEYESNVMVLLGGEPTLSANVANFASCQW